jgi:hypothetical protein
LNPGPPEYEGGALTSNYASTECPTAVFRHVVMMMMMMMIIIIIYIYALHE